MAYNTTIRPIPKPVSEEYITHYIRIRLAALKTDPQAFGSTFAGESAFSREQWCARVDNPARTTFFATSAPSTMPNASERVTGSYHDQDLHESKWIGTLSLLGPDMLRGIPFPPKIAEAEDGDPQIYMLIGMWVDPEFRKKGVGKQLVERALRTVRDFSVIDNDRGNQDEKSLNKKLMVLVLEVDDANIEARRLYESQGFVVVERTKDNKKWMALNVTGI
jgi:GNAT superfamily N-acetyltransferase